MSKNIYKLILVWAVVLTSTSCGKWLDLQPQDGITKAEFWKTKEDVRAAVFGIYSSLNNGGVEQRIFTWGEVRADLISLTPVASEDLRFVKNMNILSANSISNWSPIYTSINYCNLVIDFAKDAKQNDPTFTQAEYDSYVGEALTVRSLLYFYLVRTFRDIPLKLKGSFRDTDVLTSTPQVSAEVTIQQLITDLETAKTLVPEYHVVPLTADEAESTSNKGRITRPAVRALLADVHLWNSDYEKVLLETKEILGSDRYRLLGRYDLSISNGGTVETIFEISHRESINNIMIFLVRDAARPFAANTTELMAEVFTPNETVGADLRDSRGEGFTYTSGGTVIKYGMDEPSFFNFQIYRISDIMLMEAEALNGLGRGTEALVIINALREARGALASTNPNVTGDDEGGIDQFILNERAREFAFEGKRWFDLLRFAKKDNYSNIALLTSLIAKIVDSSVQQSAISKIRQPDSHYLPISESELERDNALKQNPFYLK